MSGVAIVGYLLANSANLTAVVAASKIVSGAVRIGTTIPAISIKKISGQQHNNVAMASAQYLMTERIQITVMADDYAETQSIMALVRAALPLSRGTINGFICQGVIPDSEGPDIYDPEIQVYFQIQDYTVTYTR